MNYLCILYYIILYYHSTLFSYILTNPVTWWPDKYYVTTDFFLKIIRIYNIIYCYNITTLYSYRTYINLKKMFSSWKTNKCKIIFYFLISINLHILICIISI